MIHSTIQYQEALMKSATRILAILLAITAGSAWATVRNVPATYATIQDGINASVNGDTVLVAPGTYQENIVYRGKRIVVSSWFALNSDPAYIQNTIINGSSPAFADSGSCVRIVNGEDSTTVLQGFTLTGGYGTLWQDEHGSFRYWEGGGVIIALSSPTVQFNIIRNNNVNRTGGRSTGGGGIRLGDGAPHIHNNIIMNNAGMYGGGIVSNYASPVITNNVIAFNTVSQAIAGSPTYGGGGLWFNGGVAGNRIENNTIAGNASSGTVSTGANGRGGGMIAVFGSTINTKNNIVWSNTQTTGGQVGIASGAALVSFSDVQDTFAGTGNISLPPLFADTSFYLQSGSPCIDAGDTSAAFNDPADPGNPGSALWPALGTRRNDMGAYGGPLSRTIASVLTPVQEPREGEFPWQFALSQNYPNPFNPTTTIRYELASSDRVSLKVYNLLGQEVATLVEGLESQGAHRVVWNGSATPSGVYLYKLTAGRYSETRKLILLK